jgi:hypothetical protein
VGARRAGADWRSSGVRETISGEHGGRHSAPPRGLRSCLPDTSQLSIRWVLAVLSLLEFAWDSLFPPNGIPGSLRIQREMRVPLAKVSVDCILRGVEGGIVAVVYDRSGHSAKYRLDHVEELRTCGKGAVSMVENPSRNASALTALRYSSSLFEMCHDAASHDK